MTRNDDDLADYIRSKDRWPERESRLSHDRGADAEWEALAREIAYAIHDRAGARDLVADHRRRIEAALSVPAPTLPALDAVVRSIIEEADADPGGYGPDFHGVVHQLREALRDAV